MMFRFYRLLFGLAYSGLIPLLAGFLLIYHAILLPDAQAFLFDVREADTYPWWLLFPNREKLAEVSQLIMAGNRQNLLLVIALLGFVQPIGYGLLFSLILVRLRTPSVAVGWLLFLPVGISAGLLQMSLMMYGFSGAGPLWVSSAIQVLNGVYWAAWIAGLSTFAGCCLLRSKRWRRAKEKV